MYKVNNAIAEGNRRTLHLQVQIVHDTPDCTKITMLAWFKDRADDVGMSFVNDLIVVPSTDEKHLSELMIGFNNRFSVLNKFFKSQITI